MRILFCFILLTGFLFRPDNGFGQATNPPAWAPTSSYEEKHIEGWRVWVSQPLLADPELCASALKLLGMQLYQITRVVPPGPLAKLRQIPLWLEANDPQFPCAVYHESREWLSEHGVNPEKTGAVEIANARNFLEWTKEQPWMVMHELAHGYHQQFLGENHAGIRRCYQNALSKGLFDSVLRINENHERHYAMTNEKEFFAEITEAFFGTNDFYPFVRAELKERDPELYDLMCEVWEVKAR